MLALLTVLIPDKRGAVVKRTTHCIALLGALFLAAGSARAQDSNPGGGFRYAPADSAEAKFTVLLRMPRRSCSGIVISQQLILTNAHCVFDLVPRDVRVEFRSERADRKITRNVSDIRVYDFYKDRGKLFSRTGDLAILRLEEKIPHAFEPIRTDYDELLEKEKGKYQAYQSGYGVLVRQGKKIDDERQKTRVLSVENSRYDSTHFRTVESPGGNASWPCSGDSGGPWWIKTGDGQLLLAGVNGFSQDELCTSAGGGGIRLTAMYDWVIANATKLDYGFDWPPAGNDASHCVNDVRQPVSENTTKIALRNKCDTSIVCKYVVKPHLDAQTDGRIFDEVTISTQREHVIPAAIKNKNLNGMVLSCRMMWSKPERAAEIAGRVPSVTYDVDAAALEPVIARMYCDAEVVSSDAYILAGGDEVLVDFQGLFDARGARFKQCQIRRSSDGSYVDLQFPPSLGAKLSEKEGRPRFAILKAKAALNGSQLRLAGGAPAAGDRMLAVLGSIPPKGRNCVPGQDTPALRCAVVGTDTFVVSRSDPDGYELRSIVGPGGTWIEVSNKDILR